jgi:rod shape determining protein RodA
MLETKKRRIENLDMLQLSLMLILIAFGLFNIYSATYSASDNQVSKIFYSQLTWVGIGLLFTIAAIVIDYRFLEKAAWVFYIILCLMLLYILVAGKAVYGAKRWLDLGFMRFQPSEVMKLVMIIILAKYFSKTSKTGDFFLKDLLVPL